MTSLILADLSDYLAPSQICIKPIEEVYTDDNSAGRPEDGAGTTEIRMEEQGPLNGSTMKWPDSMDELVVTEERKKAKKGKKMKKAQITLNDCLACSGCITSAESVLISLQSHAELLATLSSHPDLTPILSIAPQSLASFVTLHGGLPLSSALRSVRRFFKQKLGFRLVFDTTFARELSLSEAQAEFAERMEGKAKSKRKEEPLPLLASACPGWICYAEKTHGTLLPYISRVKSPQQVQGSLVKGQWVADRLGKKPEEVYHVAVMPCYDKKLEASRPDFLVKGAKGDGTVPGKREVDCVLTTGEVQRLMDDKGWDFRANAISGSSDGEDEDFFLPDLVPPRGTSSGGYLHNVIRGYISALPLSSLSSVQIDIEPRRGLDYVDYTVTMSSADGAPPIQALKAAQCYGFRNLQNLVRKVGREQGLAVTRGAAGTSTPTARSNTRGKSAAALAAAARRAARRGGSAPSSGAVTPTEAVPVEDRPYDYVEVMACPSGCVNGGGQLPPPKRDVEGMPLVEDGEQFGDPVGKPVKSAKEWVTLVERAYWAAVSSRLSTMDATGKALVLPEGAVEVHPSVVPFVLPHSDAERRAKELLKGISALERKRVMRTSYRAVESEEVNGLAVKW